MSDLDTSLQDHLDRIAAGEPAEALLRQLAADPATMELAAMLELALRLEQRLPIALPAPRRARMQAELQAAFQARSAARPPARLAWFGGSRLLLRGLAVVTALILAAGSAVVASADSLPGQLLYPVKRAAEQARLSLALDLGTRTRLRLDFSEARMDELQQLADRGLAISPAQIEALADSHRALLDSARATGDPALLDAARARTAAHHAALERLKPQLGQSAVRAIDETRRDLDAIEAGREPGPSPRPLPGTAWPAEGAGLTPGRGLPVRTATGAAGDDGPSLATPGPGSAAHASLTPRPILAMTAQASAVAASPAAPGAATLVPYDPEATLRSIEADRRATRSAMAAAATARAEAIRATVEAGAAARRATLEAVRATDPAAARATREALRATDQAQRATREARRATEEARPTPPPRDRTPEARQTRAPIRSTPPPPEPSAEPSVEPTAVGTEAHPPLPPPAIATSDPAAPAPSSTAGP